VSPPVGKVDKPQSLAL